MWLLKYDLAVVIHTSGNICLVVPASLLLVVPASLLLAIGGISCVCCRGQGAAGDSLDWLDELQL
jgi:hypothetical protein